MNHRSPIKDSAHLTRLVSIYDGVVRKIPLASGTLKWIIQFDSNNIAFPNVLSNYVWFFLHILGSLLNRRFNVSTWASDEYKLLRRLTLLSIQSIGTMYLSPLRTVSEFRMDKACLTAVERASTGLKAP